MHPEKFLAAGTIAVLVVATACHHSNAQTPVFTLSSPDLAGGTFATKYILNGFGCAGQNVSPALMWSNIPRGRNPCTSRCTIPTRRPEAASGIGRCTTSRLR